MGKTIYISEELHGFLSQKSLGDSMDATIKKLLHLETFEGKVVNKQVSREKLAPIEDYFWPILNYIGLPRKEMQKAVGFFLSETGHFEKHPDELVKMRNTQERWKLRFSTALNTLKKLGLIESDKMPTKNWQGGVYRVTASGVVKREEYASHLPPLIATAYTLNDGDGESG
jgi:hypothetical protein